jgi:hypothetical protein
MDTPPRVAPFVTRLYLVTYRREQMVRGLLRLTW